MTEATLWRVITLAIGMLIVGFVTYSVKTKQDEENDTSVKKEAKKTAIKGSVIFSVLYMVIVLGAAG
ncbi:hypothetical protein [Halarsenatibacter silvermanii]|uniref:Uncharacterized protein n=1 Tax=Halarsenatibacter silvermanii TaxID=321763 RepID=A0A1G9SQ91_9FIRM|nr:hypothetical protein [Halarsenatibacter silvermanii]SDM37626.1 hypothetical protein SAMN04488692_13023 [Halarsenatibacter silvermanii]